MKARGLFDVIAMENVQQTDVVVIKEKLVVIQSATRNLSHVQIKKTDLNLRIYQNLRVLKKNKIYY